MSRGLFSNGGTLLCAAMILFIVFRDYIKVERTSQKEDYVETLPREPQISGSSVAKWNYSTSVKYIRVNQEYTAPKKVELFNGQWQVVVHGNDKNTFLYSAHMDTRTTIEHITVRIVAVTEDHDKKFYCVLWKENGKNSVVEATKQPAGEWPGYHDRSLTGIILSCGIGQDIDTPTHVSIINDFSTGPSTYLKIAHPRAPMSSGPQFGVCLFFENSNVDIYRVVEWMELFKMFGVREVTMYDNSDDSDLEREGRYAMQTYIDDEFVVIHPAPNITNEIDEDHILILDPMFNDCMYRNRLRYSYIVCLTMNEMLYPKLSQTYQNMLLDVENIIPGGNQPIEYVIANANFFTDLPSKSDGIMFVSQKYSHRAKVDEHGRTSTSVLNPSSCAAIQSRQCLKVVAMYSNLRNWKVNVSTGVAEIASYNPCIENLDDDEDCDKKIEILYKDDLSELGFSKSFVARASDVLIGIAQRAEMRGDISADEMKFESRPEQLYSLDDLQKLVGDPWKEEKGSIGAQQDARQNADWESFKKTFTELKASESSISQNPQLPQETIKMEHTTMRPTYSSRTQFPMDHYQNTKPKITKGEIGTGELRWKARNISYGKEHRIRNKWKKAQQPVD